MAIGVADSPYYLAHMETQPSFGTRLLLAFRNLVLVTVFIGLAAAALYAMSQVNARTYGLEVRQGQLVVLKGKMLPTGADPWMPADPQLADTYAPIDVEGQASVIVTTQKFEDRDELDRALFLVLETLARPRLSAETPKDLERGLLLVRRAERLHGLTDAQRDSLRKMQTDVAFFLARTRLDDARRQLEEALSQLKLAAESDSKTRAQASLMLLAVEPQVKLLASTLRVTTLTADGGGNLSKALEPQLKALFEALGKQPPVPTPPPAPEPTVKPDRP